MLYNSKVWAYANNEFLRCRIIQILYPEQPDDCDTDDDFDENEMTPPLTTSIPDNMSNCSTPPPSSRFHEDCDTPPPNGNANDNNDNNPNSTMSPNQSKQYNHDGLCAEGIPLYLVVCLTPRFKQDIPCRHLLNHNPCPFEKRKKCMFSHG